MGIPNPCTAVFAPLLRLLRCDGDTDLEADRKACACAMGVGGVVVGLSNFIDPVMPSVYLMLHVTLTLSASCALLLYVFCTKAAPTSVFEWVTYVWAAGMLTSVLVMHQSGYSSSWAYVIVLLDLCVVNQLPPRVATITMSGTCVALFVMGVLAAADLQLPGADGLACHCDSPPCDVHAARRVVDTLFGNVAVVVLDFYLTRRYAHQMTAEKAALQRTVDIMHQVANCIADYDMDSISTLIEVHHHCLPRVMVDDLRTMEKNMRMYRPYLPDIDALVERHRESNVHHVHPSVVPPGMDCGTATLVFTDIRASTAIWEAVPDAMHKAIKVHNTEIRVLIAALCGYEVKTVGDSFMVAFDFATAGVIFALRVHSALLAATWPPGLFDFPTCAPRHGIWGGLTVRIGVNTGPTTLETNHLTQRVDYLGHTVNLASRLESTCPPGAVAVRASLWEDVRPLCDADVESVPDTVNMRGVSEPVEVLYLWPEGLAARQRDPLDPVVRGSPASSCASVLTTLAPRMWPSLRQTHATVGMLQVVPGEDVVRNLSLALDTITVHVSRSRGSLVNVLGYSVTVAWNTVRPLASHTESALRFARSVKGEVQSYLGIGTGPVYHGDVGSLSQRFITVVGSAVDASWSVSLLAKQYERSCLLRWVMQSPMPTALLQELEDSSLGDARGVVYQLAVPKTFLGRSFLTDSCP